MFYPTLIDVWLLFWEVPTSEYLALPLFLFRSFYDSITDKFSLLVANILAPSFSTCVWSCSFDSLAPRRNYLTLWVFYLLLPAKLFIEMLDSYWIAGTIPLVLMVEIWSIIVEFMYWLSELVGAHPWITGNDKPLVWCWLAFNRFFLSENSWSMSYICLWRDIVPLLELNNSSSFTQPKSPTFDLRIGCFESEDEVWTSIF